MTPLAFKILKEATLPLDRRTFVDQHDVVQRLQNEVHCFEVSAVFNLINEMGKQLHELSIVDGMYADRQIHLNERLAFLPAPKTWVEFVGDEPGHRMGFLLEEADTLALVTVCIRQGEHFSSVFEFAIPLHGHSEFGQLRTRDDCGASRGEQVTMIFRLYATLAFVNTPKIIGRREHAPHKALQKALSKLRGHSFELRPWSEIVLRVAKPLEIDDGEPHEASLTGRRALHFCRAHLRIRLGRLEYVSSHWRGDATVGIKPARYVVRP